MSELQTAIAQARSAWPGVENPDDEFARFLSGRGPPGELHLDDLWLACACARGDPAALASLEQRYLSELPLWLGGPRGNAAFVEEVGQLLRERLLVQREGRPPVIAGYSGRGTLASWLRVAALRTASNLRRRDKAQSGAGDSALPEALAHQDPEVLLFKRRSREAFEAVLRDAFALLDPAERTLLRMRFIDGLGIDKLSPIFGVSRATAARRLAAARARLLEATLDLARQRLRLEPAELKSLLRMVRSDLEISLRGLFRTR